MFADQVTGGHKCVLQCFISNNLFSSSFHEVSKPQAGQALCPESCSGDVGLSLHVDGTENRQEQLEEVRTTQREAL
jgi:hypothetical protein